MTDWEARYQAGETPWEKGAAAPPLVELLEELDHDAWGGGPVLVPGCGFGHDVRALSAALKLPVVGVDISPMAVERAREFPAAGLESYEPADFLNPAWRIGREFTAVWEHTCFCAIDPGMRDQYAAAVADLLPAGGLLAGVFFLNPYDPGDDESGPPFATTVEEVENRFAPWFKLEAGRVPGRAYAGREGREWTGVFRKSCRSHGLRAEQDASSVTLTKTMKFLTLIFPLLALSAGHAPADAARLYVNDKKAPEQRADLEAIQKSLVAALPKARAATVAIEIKDGSGSGVIVSEDGLVLTAAHVATGVNKKVTVVLEDGTRLEAKTLGLVADNDAAMIQITEKGSYPFVEIDRDETTRLGDWVFSLGHSGGFDLERGSVVRLGRLVRTANSTFQSDCMLIGGDSGGPLFDMTGKLIGIHSRVGQQLQVNMHVPMSEFIGNWEGMLDSAFIGEGPYAQMPVKGSGFLGLATEAREQGGLRVTKVGSQSPAEEAGLEEGDVLLKLNEVALESREQMQDLLKEMSAGDEVVLETERDGKAETFTLELGER